MNIRIGHGFDVHAFGPGAEVVLGGIRIPHDRGLVAHSDGDVVVHALCDALLGAAALGDIGQLFPDDDPANAARDSREFLAAVLGRLQQVALAPGNVDVTVIAEAPRLAAHIPAMRASLAVAFVFGFLLLDIASRQFGWSGPTAWLAWEICTA